MSTSKRYWDISIQSGFKLHPKIGLQNRRLSERTIEYNTLSLGLPEVKRSRIVSRLSSKTDGAGYFIGAKTWVPFAAAHKAFILYLCWEQAKLRGNEVALTKLDDTEAHLTLGTHFFSLYFTATHLKPIISLDEYKRIFETIWQDRAVNAGWNLQIQYANDYKVTFVFTRSN
jgi:hypothetical protein